MDDIRITTVSVDDIEEMPLPNGSWSKMLLTGDTVSGIVSSLGYSIFKPGTELSMVSHDTEEVAFAISGSGVIRTEQGDIPVAEGQAVHIPARLWHAVANNGTENLVMVFGFPYPAFPPTERR